MSVLAPPGPGRLFLRSAHAVRRRFASLLGLGKCARAGHVHAPGRSKVWIGVTTCAVATYFWEHAAADWPDSRAGRHLSCESEPRCLARCVGMRDGSSDETSSDDFK
eukprot:5367870-Pleurochrysis_carterae.AAC.1